MKAKVALFSDKLDMECESKRRGEGWLQAIFFWATLSEIELSLTENSQYYLLPLLFLHSLRPRNLILLRTLKINWTSKCLSVRLYCNILLLLSLSKVFFIFNFQTMCCYPLAKSLCSTFLSHTLSVTPLPLIFACKKYIPISK